MAFNATTYRMNKYRRRAWEHLAEARALKARVLAGEERWTGEGKRLPTLVALARSQMGLFRTARAIQQIERTRP